MKTASNWLGPRECEVLCRLAKKHGDRLRGGTFKQAASQMGISENTARSYAKRAYKKLGVTDRYEALEVHPPHALTPNESCHRVHTTNTPEKPAA